MRLVVIVLIYIVTNQIGSSQSEIEDSIEHKLTFHFNTNTFIKNNEYFGAFTKGFTGIGFILQPHLQYKIDNHTTVSLGYHVLKYSGLDSFSEAIPLFRIETILKNDLTLIIGHLKGGRHHQLSEPLYRIDRDYQNQIEYGVQSLFEKEWISMDTWLHWEKFIQKNDPFPEELYVGSNTTIRLFRHKGFSASLTSELLISHLGGQIDAALNPDRTILNYSVGPKFTFKLSATTDLSFEYVYYKSSVVKQVADRTSLFFIPLESGSAVYPQLYIDHNSINASIGFWNANSFVSPRGEFLFFSLSDYDQSIVEEDRNLWTSSLSYDFKPFHYLSLFTQLGLYYDVSNDQLDYTYGLRILLKLNFSLKHQ